MHPVYHLIAILILRLDSNVATTLTSQELSIINLLRQMNQNERNAIYNLLKVFAGSKNQP